MLHRRVLLDRLFPHRTSKISFYLCNLNLSLREIWIEYGIAVTHRLAKCPV